MPRLSIVIPSLIFDPSIEHTLISVLQNRPEYSEVIVVTAQRYQDPYELGREVRFLAHENSRTRLELLNHACQQSRGAVVHVLMPGVEVADGWTDNVLRHFADDKVAAVAPVVMADSTATRARAIGVSYSASGSRRVVGSGFELSGQQTPTNNLLAPTIVAGFYRHHVLSALQGFDVQLGETLADVELGLAFQDLGLTTVHEPESRVIMTQPLVSGSRTFEEARQAERLFRRQLSHNKLGHALLVAVECLTGFPRPRMITRLCGRMAARREVDHHSAYQQRLDRARQQLQQSRERSTIRGEFDNVAGRVGERSKTTTQGRRSAAA